MRRFMLVALMCAVALPLFGQAAQTSIQLGDLDRSVDPCTDFSAYASGSWHKANPIPSYMDRWSRRWQSGEGAKEQLKTILDEVSAKRDWPKGSVEQLTGDFYGACMDEAAINKAGIAPLRPLLAQIDQVKDRRGLEPVILKLHGMFVTAPFYLFSQPDNHNPSQVLGTVVAAGLGLPDRDYYVKEEPRFKEAREKYVAYATKMFMLAGESEEKAKADAAIIMEMETDLAKASLDNVALRDPHATDHKTTFAQLKAMAPNFDWDAYFKAGKLPTSADLNVAEPKFMAEFNRQLAQVPLADWKTYLKWHLLNSAAPALSQDFVNENFNFFGAYLAGAKEIKPRWKRCAESTDQLLGEASGKKYVEKYFPPEAKARMEDLVHNILLAMGETIKGLEWMGPETKQKALEKLSTFNVKVGYPDKWKDYSSIDVRRDAYWNDVVNASLWNVQDNWKQVGKPVDRGRWGMTPPTSNAYYNPLLNEIVFPAGILQPPAFDLHNVDAVNYGAIGVVIGHEISHGFDDQGAKFDAQGRLQNWWTEADEKKFDARTQCVVNQFDNYFIEPNIHHNGKLVLGESIGDLAGAKIAYRAFQIAQKKNPAPTVDGFSPEQQFFIAWGQFRTDNTRPETQRLMVQGDPHPISKYRVIGPLSNLPEFQQAFQCKEGSPMVRSKAERCEVW